MPGPANRRRRLAALTWLVCALLAAEVAADRPSSEPAAATAPANGATDVNPDTHLQLTFTHPPRLARAGRVHIYDETDRRVADELDIPFPSGPGDPVPVERRVIGGFSAGFHVYPVIVHGTTATIYPHPHALAYGKTYRVTIDAGVLAFDGSDATARVGPWRFRTRAAAPAASRDDVTVSADGHGDFDTVQGAVDFVPDLRDRPMTIRIRNGTYEDIVYFHHKRNLTFIGESRDGVHLGYANNETLNGPPPGVATNETPGTFPYRRAAFMADDSTGITIVNLTIENFTTRGGGQAEALLLSGGQDIVTHVTLIGHQDTLQVNDRVYIEDSTIQGDTDFLWGRGPAFFTRCELREGSTGPFMWVRSTSASHGFVFDQCVFDAPGAEPPGPYLARNTAAYPASEVVLLDCTLGLINPAAWQLPPDGASMRYWEYQSVDARTGAAADVSGRHPVSRQLTAADAALVAEYRDPAYVLGGWTPVLAPIILTRPAPVTVSSGEAATLAITVASVPLARVTWAHRGVPVVNGPEVSGADTPTLVLAHARPDDAGTYVATATSGAAAPARTTLSLVVR